LINRLTVMLIPDNAGEVKQFRVAMAAVKGLVLGVFLLFSLIGYFVIDYIDLKDYRARNQILISENNHLKGEAEILMENLEEVKGSLRRIQDFSGKLTELVSLKVNRVAKKTGIGPLTHEEFSTAQTDDDGASRENVPLGINMDSLVFKPVLNRLSELGKESNKQALELKQLLSSLGKKRSLLSSVPSANPVNGWITSNFGRRISPFTGKGSMHKGIDVASNVGTAINSPANGVVIFSGKKAGYGNFIMIAHGYGIVTRYGHNAQNMVQAGQKVKRGEQIGTVGMSGRTTGPHLHYEVWVNGLPVNPKKFILESF